MNKKFIVFTVLLLFCSGLIFIACTPRQAEPSSGLIEIDQSSSEPLVWSVDSDCAMCHSTEADSAQTAAAEYSLHASQPDVTCMTCHTDSAALEQVHAEYATGTPPHQLMETDIANDTCLNTCHEPSHNAEALKTATAGSIVLTDNEGTTVNPHDLPSNNDHDTSISCTSCHVMHGDKGTADASQIFCSSCHHENVYECGTCH